MLANAVLRPECKHFQSHRSPKESLSYKFTTLRACTVQFFLPIRGYMIFLL